jgi:hypothetical protein
MKHPAVFGNRAHSVASNATGVPAGSGRKAPDLGPAIRLCEAEVCGNDIPRFPACAETLAHLATTKYYKFEMRMKSGDLT